MRNYIILNGKNSNEINGLLIQELPPISKPLIRTEVEEIDGRDGDIVTPLGYSAYDKELTIGLYKDFDVNEVAAYFNSEGTVIFSNEPDKYYYYQITAQIDFERLVRYRTATVTMHCQPFKYSATEQPITEDASGTVSDEGTNLALENTAEAPFSQFDLKGNTEQDGTPTPDAPVAVQTVTGENVVKIHGKNMLDSKNASVLNAYVDRANHRITTQSATRTVYVECQPNTTYTVSKTLSARFALATTANVPANNVPIQDDMQNNTATSITITTGATAKYLCVFYHHSSYDTLTPQEILDTMQIEQKSQATAYESFKGQDYEVYLDENILSVPDGEVTNNGVTATFSGGNANVSRTSAGSGTSFVRIYLDTPITIQSGETFTLSAGNTQTIGATDSGSAYMSIRLATASSDDTSTDVILGTTNASMTKTVTSDTTYNRIVIRTAGSLSPNDIIIRPKLSIKGGDNIELCELDDSYQDYIYKNGDKWYKHKVVGKTSFDGTENWFKSDSSTSSVFAGALGVSSLGAKVGTTEFALSDHFDFKSAIMAGTFAFYNGTTTYNNIRLCLSTSTAADIDAFKAWLAAHPTVVYYVLDTPVEEEITNASLVAQLNDIADHAHAYKERTHVRSLVTDGNVPHIIAAEVDEDNESTITNAGNYLSKPKITVYGSGDISLYINDMHALQITLGDEGYITIDTAQMEAYKDTLDNLKNRLVIGDYSNARLKPGANKIHFTGTVTKYVVENYSRWL